MQTLAQTLTAGNLAAGQNVFMGNGTGTGGGQLNMETGGLFLAPGSAIAGDVSGNASYSASSHSFHGGNLSTNGFNLDLAGGAFKLNGGLGSGASSMNLDGASVDTGTLDGTTPMNQATPSEWWHIYVGGVSVWVPLYQ